MQPINIHLDRNETTRRYSRRVVWNVLRIFGSIALGVLIATLWIHHDWTGRNSPSQANQAVYLTKSPSVLVHTSEAYTQPLLEGSSYQLSDGLTWSRYGLTQHIEDGKTIAVTIDRVLDQNIAVILELNGYFIQQERGKTIISLYPIEEETLKRHVFGFSVLADGRLHDFDLQKTMTIRITDEYIQLRGLSRANSITTPFGQKSYLSTWEFSALPDIFRPLSSIPAERVELVSFFDTQGIGFRIKFHETNLTPEILAQIGKQYMLQNDLSTSAWTISDGTHFSEIRSDDEINSDIQSIDGIIQINLSQNDQSLRITQTEEVLIISNRIISLTTDENHVSSSCLPRAKQTFVTDLIREESMNTSFYSPMASMLLSPWKYAQLVRRGRILRMCR